MKSLPLCLLAIACATSFATAAITLDLVENFSGVHDWASGDANPNPPVLVPSGGPLGSGDAALRVTSNGGGGAGGRLIVYNQILWIGDYTSAGISAIAADLRNGGNTILSMRLALNGPGGWFVTAPTALTAFSGWKSEVFDVGPGSLVSASGTDVAATLAAVSELRILHSAVVDYRGAKVSSSFSVDNVRAIPEPASVVYLMIGVLCLFFRKH